MVPATPPRPGDSPVPAIDQRLPRGAPDETPIGRGAIYVVPMVLCDVGRGSLSGRVFGPLHAPAVLLIAGGGGSMSTWARLVPEVAPTMTVDIDRLSPIHPSLAAELRVAVFDQAGVGESVDVRPAMSADEAAADALAVGRVLLGERFTVVGISLGGAAATRLALSTPQAVIGLVLACTFPSASMCVASGVTDDLTDLTEGSVEAEVARSFSTQFRLRCPAVFAAVVELSASAVVCADMGDSAIHLFLSHEGHALSDVSVPTTVVCGDRDRVFESANSIAIATAIPHARLELIAGAGHALHAEAPERLAEIIRQACRPT